MDQRPLKLLVVADGTPESRVAAWFAGFRAARSGACVAIMAVIEPHGFEHWLGVGEEIRRDEREAAEAHLSDLAEDVKSCGAVEVEFIISEGQLLPELMRAIEEDRNIRGLVVAAAPGGDPGPLVSTLARGGRGLFGARALPVVVVPGALTREEVEEIS